MDNTTSCAYINKFGGKKTELDKLARDIWFWCLERKIHLSAAHVPGVSNTEADEMSRKFNDDLEWSIREETFKVIVSKFPKLDIDLFTSRLNFKLKQYVSLRPEPDDYAVDAFSLLWAGHLHYIFPPFSLISRILQKLETDQAEAVLIAPLWSTQVWWASLLHLISGPCYILPKPQEILHLPHKPEQIHPLKKMRLAVFRLSGNPLKPKIYQQKLSTSLCNHGGNPQKLNTTHTSKNGSLSVGNGLIPLNHL